MPAKPKRRPKRARAQRGKGVKARSGADIEFDHAFIPTASFGDAWKFWTDVVGLKGQTKWGTPEYAGSVKLGKGSLVVAQGEEGFYDELGYTAVVTRPQLYLRTRNLDALHKSMAERGARIVRAPLTTHYGARCFSVAGPDGMVVVFVESK